MKQHDFLNTKTIIPASFATCIDGLGFSQRIVSKYAAVRRTDRLPAFIFLKLFTATGTQHKTVNNYRQEVINKSFIINIALCLKIINRFEQVVKHYSLLLMPSFATSSKAFEHYVSTGVDRNDSFIQSGERDVSGNPAKAPALSHNGAPQGLPIHYKTHIYYPFGCDNIQRYGGTANVPNVHAHSQTSQDGKWLPVWDALSIPLPATFADIRLNKALFVHKHFTTGYDFALPVNRSKIQGVDTTNAASEAYTSTSPKNIALNRCNLFNPSETAQMPEASARTHLKQVMQTQRDFADRNGLALLTTTARIQRILKTVVTSGLHDPQVAPLNGMEYVNPATTAQKTVLPGLNNPANVFDKKTNMTLRKLPSPQTTATVENRETAKRENAVENHTHKAYPRECQKELTNHEISKMADSVYKIIEKRIAIEKERRGWR